MNIKKFENFSELTGWVNVKIDNQLYIRMARYIPALDKLSKGGIYNLAKKLDVLSKVDKLINKSDVSLRDKISVLTILQYLKEIRDEKQFNPSSSGFLLEGFLATLIHGEIIGGYGIADITTTYNELDPVIFKTNDPEKTHRRKLDFQIKLYKRGGDIKVNFTTLCDYYVICIKDSDKIEVHILSGKNIDDKVYIGNFARRIRGTEDFIRYSGEDNKKSYIVLDTNKLSNSNKGSARKIYINNIDNLLSNCTNNIYKSIKSVYDQLSELHYDVDSLVSGIDKDKKPIDVDTAADNANRSIENIQKEVLNLRKGIN